MTTFELVIGTIIPTLWIAWLLYWWVSARNVKATRESLAAELRHRAPLMLYTGILLAFVGMVVAIGEVRGLVAVAFAAIAFVVKSRAEADLRHHTVHVLKDQALSARLCRAG
jgi:hypothetical protein